MLCVSPNKTTNQSVVAASLRTALQLDDRVSDAEQLAPAQRRALTAQQLIQLLGIVSARSVAGIIHRGRYTGRACVFICVDEVLNAFGELDVFFSYLAADIVGA